MYNFNTVSSGSVTKTADIFNDMPQPKNRYGYALKQGENTGDVFAKKKSDKKKIIAASFLSVFAAVSAFALLAKSGKLGKKCQGFVDNIFNSVKKNSRQVQENKPVEVKIPEKLTETNLPIVQSPNNPLKTVCADEAAETVVKTMPVNKLANEAVQENAGKRIFDHAENIGDGKIRVFYSKDNKMLEPVELPEFLYHVTSAESMKNISESGMLRASRNEQLTGVYLLDGENFLGRYAETTVKGKKKDLFSSLFRQANKGNKGINPAEQELVIIKIPTKDLCASGKLRIRRQEDFFEFKDAVDALSEKVGKKYTIRSLCNDAVRADFRNRVISQNVMPESEIDKLISDMTQKLHRGYSIQNASGFSNGNSIEYIFNHDINFSEFQNLTMRKFSLADYAVPGTNNKKFTPESVANLFNDSSSYVRVA